MFLVASFVLGMGDFFSSSQTALLTESVPAHWRTRALSGYRFCVDLGATIGPLLLAGLLQVTGFETMVLIAAALLLLAASGGVLGGRAARRVVQSAERTRPSELVSPVG
jgi:MFS family permease